MKRTISIAKGKGSIGHNSREFKAENVDPERIHLNTCFVNENLKEVYHKLFDSALQDYNAKQKRNDRKIFDYYEKIRTSKQEKLFYEIIVQVGNYEDMLATDENGNLAEKILKEYMIDFQKRNSTLYVFSAHLHMDEATPHLHIDFVPYTSENTRGLETKTTLKGALGKLGFTGGAKSDTELNQWQNSEKETVSKIMLEHGIEWEKKDTHKEHLSVLNYKKEMRSQEVAELDKKVEVSKKQLQSVSDKKSKLKNVDGIAVKPTFLDSGKVVVSKDELEEVKVLAKKQIVYESKENKLIIENKNLKKETIALKQVNAGLNKELDQFKSIKNRLAIAALESENIKLKKLLNKIYDFVEKMGLKAQLDKFLQRKIEKER